MPIPSSFPPVTGALTGTEIVGVVIEAAGPGTGVVASVTTAQIAALGGGGGGSGTVTSVGITNGSGLIALSGTNPVTASGNINVDLSSGVQASLALAGTALQPIGGLAGSVTNANLTLNAKGQITALSSGTVGSVTSVGIASSNLTVSGGPITGSGTLTVNLPASGVVAGSYTQVNATVDTYGRVTAASSGSPPPTTILQQLNYANPATTGNPVVPTLDGGLQVYTDSEASQPWQSAVPYSLLNSGVPIGIAPSGNIGANGAVTFSVALDYAYPNIYLYFPNAAIGSGIQPGCWLVQMSSTTQGIIYNNLYRRGQPQIPPTIAAVPFVSNGPTSGVITAGGSGYDGGGSNTYTGVALTGGTGTGAVATIVVTSGVVTKVTLTAWGSGYSTSDTLSAAAASLGGSGSGFTMSAPGTYLQVTGQAIYLHMCPVPGNAVGLNGEIEVNIVGTNDGSSGINKQWYIVYGGSVIASQLLQTTVTNWGARHRIVNAGATNSQVILDDTSNFYGEPGAGSTNKRQSIDTTVGQSLWVQLNMESAGGWGIVQNISVVCRPSGFLDYPPPMVFTKSGATVQPPGAAALGYGTNLFYIEPKITDIDFSATPGTALSFFPGLYYNTPPAWSNSTGPNPPYATMQTINGKSILCLSQKGDGVTPGLSAVNGYSEPGALPLMTCANGFYLEWASWISNEDPDHWPALWALPQEHKSSGDVTYYVELDVDELASATAGPGGYNTNVWQDTTVINWTKITSGGSGYAGGTSPAPFTNVPLTGGTGTGAAATITVTSGVVTGVTFTNYGAGYLNSDTLSASAVNLGNNGGSGFAMKYGTFSPTDYQNSFNTATLGKPVDRTREHIFGMSYDPVGKVLQTWLDGVKQPFSQSTASFDTHINPYHYYSILGPQQHGKLVPYNMYIRYVAAWTP